MTNPTSNFNWQMPTASDLVTDLPADFETFGQAVDTTLADLKGGTTGQVLSKASNTDMDFTWVAADDTNAIQNAIVDAKGDLIAASAADTPARLAVGNNGETLVADSSTSTGLRYQAPVNANPVINSAFQVWQRGTSISVGAASNAYTADRWQLFTQSGQASTVSRQVTNDTTNLPNIQYCARVQRNSGQTGTGQMSFIQGMETINSIPYAGKTVTLSFYARAGANYSPTSSAFNFMIYTGTGTDQFPTSYTGGATAANASVTLTTTWQRFTVTGTVATTATEIGLYAYWSATGTAGANDYVEITGVQLEVGSVATPFKTYAATIQGELAACQRYYWRSTAAEIYSPYGQGYAISTTNGQMYVQMPVQMRVRPTSVDYANLSLGIVGVAGYPVTSLVLNASDAGTQMVTLNCTTAGTLTQFRPYGLNANNTTSSYVGLNAEL
jgi:hypothetical protein